MAFINPKDALQVGKTKQLKTISFPSELVFLEANPFVQIALGDIPILSNLIGDYNYTNIFAAITMGTYFGVENQHIRKAIENYIPSNNRSQIIEKESNQIILDAYNANPSSMKVALENFSKIKKASKVVILGDMFELGNESSMEHQEIVNLADAFCFSQTLYVGAHFYKAQTKNKQFENFEALEAYLIENTLENQSVLIKGSRGMQLERVLAFIN
jgi:UDP-N-acetylmuramoyl-tripeptide--D-alanyl-D-alanine ligase